MKTLSCQPWRGCRWRSACWQALPPPPSRARSDLFVFGNNDLKHVAEAVKKDKRLTIAVVGTGSSILAGPDGPPSGLSGPPRGRAQAEAARRSLSRS